MAAGRKWSEKGKNMFKNPYAQFVKIETDLRKTWQVADHAQLVAHQWRHHLVVRQLPEFALQRAALCGRCQQYPCLQCARSIGPGRYYTNQSRLSYLDQTGDIKLQANVEFRPRIFGNLYGAVFLDAGNVWAMRDDGYRAGSEI